MPEALQDLSNQGYWILILDARIKMRKIKIEEEINIDWLSFICPKFYLLVVFNCTIMALWFSIIFLMLQIQKWGFRGFRKWSTAPVKGRVLIQTKSTWLATVLRKGLVSYWHWGGVHFVQIWAIYNTVIGLHCYRHAWTEMAPAKEKVLYRTPKHMKKLGCAKKFLKFIFLSPSSLLSLSLQPFLLLFSSIPYFLSFFLAPSFL